MTTPVNQPQYIAGSVTLSAASATLIATPSGPGGVLVTASATTVFFGGPSVTSTGTNGFSVPATSPVLIPSQGPDHGLYAAGTGTVTFIYPGGN